MLPHSHTMFIIPSRDMTNEHNQVLGLMPRPWCLVYPPDVADWHAGSAGQGDL